MQRQALTPAQIAYQGKVAIQHANFLQSAGVLNAAQAEYNVAGDQMKAAVMVNNFSHQTSR